MTVVYERTASSSGGTSTSFWDLEDNLVTMAANDVYRLVLMWVTMPGLILTVAVTKLLKNRYSLAMNLHLVAALMFIIDNLRVELDEVEDEKEKSTEEEAALAEA